MPCATISVYPWIAGDDLLVAAANLPFTIGICGGVALCREDIGDSDDEITEEQQFNRDLAYSFINQIPAPYACGACVPWPQY